MVISRKLPKMTEKGPFCENRHYLKTGKIPEETIFPSSVVSFEGLPKTLKATDKLFYGQYKKKNPAMIRLLQKLTDGKFKEGAIARIIARELWSAGKAPTFKEYAERWLSFESSH